MFVATLSVALMMLQAVDDRSAPTSAKDEVSLYFFMHSLYQRTHGDAVKARRYLQRTPFQEDEVVKLVAISRNFAFTYRDRIAEGRSLHTNTTISEELRSRLGSSLYLKVLQYCRRSIEPQMRSVPPP